MISTVTLMAFKDELSKIAMDQVAKDRLKRFGITTLAIGAGTGAGIGAGELTIRALEKKLGPGGVSVLKKRLTRYGIPAATAATTALIIAMRRTTDKAIDEGILKKKLKQ